MIIGDYSVLKSMQELTPKSQIEVAAERTVNKVIETNAILL